jgi:hypothetical protein
MSAYLIWSIEHNAWWRGNWEGYTTKLGEAGIYSEADSQKVLTRANYPPPRVHECRIPVESVGLDPAIQPWEHLERS